MILVGSILSKLFSLDTFRYFVSKLSFLVFCNQFLVILLLVLHFFWNNMPQSLFWSIFFRWLLLECSISYIFWMNIFNLFLLNLLKLSFLLLLIVSHGLVLIKLLLLNLRFWWGLRGWSWVRSRLRMIASNILWLLLFLRRLLKVILKLIGMLFVKVIILFRIFWWNLRFSLVFVNIWTRWSLLLFCLSSQLLGKLIFLSLLFKVIHFKLVHFGIKAEISF